jgi:hypothetical protein
MPEGARADAIPAPVQPRVHCLYEGAAIPIARSGVPEPGKAPGVADPSFAALAFKAMEGLSSARLVLARWKVKPAGGGAGIW